MTNREIDALREPRRLAALRRTGLLDSAPEASFDRLTRLAARMLGAPVSLVSLVDRDRQFFKSSVGLSDPWSSRRQTPLTHSFCQHAVQTREPLVIEDARDHPLVHDNLAIPDLGVVAYLGIPLVAAEGQALGALCVIDAEPRRWTPADVELLTDLADLVVREIELRAAVLDTERERREKAALLDSVAEGVFGLDHEGRCTFLNRAGVALLGYRPDEVLGRNMHALVHHSRADGSPYPAEACPIFRAFWAGDSASVDDEVLWRKDGTPLAVEYACRPLTDDAGRRGAVVTFADVGERARMERELRLSEARFRMMFEQSPVSTQVFAPDGTSLYANPAWERLWGVAHDQIAGYNVLHDPQLARLGVAPYIKRGFAGELLEVPAVLYQPEETIGGISRVSHRWVQALLFPVRDETGAIREVVLMHDDVTDARRAEEERTELLANERAARAEAEAAVRARDEFLSIASHELRTPVTGIKGYAQSLRRAQARGRLDGERLDRSLRAIETSADRLAQLTGDLLDVSRIRTGQLPFNPRPLDLAALVREVAERFEDRLDPTHRLDVRTGDLPCPVLADADRVDQVLTNLIENAAKYSPDGGTIDITISTESGEAVVAVRDRGIGLPPESAGTIFEPFGRAPNAAGHGIPGMGLGLYICRTIVERHGGSIRAASAGEGHGTTVTFRLPARDAGTGADAGVATDSVE